MHDEDAGARDAAIEILQIALHHRLQVSVHHDRAGAFVFAELGKNLVGDRERHAKLFQGAGDGILSLRVGERKQQRDGNGFGMLLLNIF